MLGVVLAGLRRHLHRMAATLLAVAFLAGSLVFGGTITHAYRDTFARGARNT